MRVCICDDQRLFGEVLTSLLESHGHDVVAVVDTPEAALDVVRSEEVDICITDLHFGRNAELHLSTAIPLLRAHVKVVILTDDERACREVANEAEVDACLLKSQGPASLLTCLAAVRAGRPLRSRPLNSLPPVPPHATGQFLTPRELEVLQGLAAGASTARLASQLGVRSATVRAHLQSLFAKLGVHSRIEAVALAVDRELVALDRGD